MKYTEEMILHSESGYCMPFEEPQGKEVEMTLGYGEQTTRERASRFSTMALTSTPDITGCLPSRAESCQGSAMIRYTGYARLSGTGNMR